MILTVINPEAMVNGACGRGLVPIFEVFIDLAIICDSISKNMYRVLCK